jgi:hypothetical protein
LLHDNELLYLLLAGPHQKDKAARRAERARRAPGEAAPDGVDPDIAGIRPGPQPPFEWQIEGDE